jgi:AraC-like DNA-binding protein
MATDDDPPLIERVNFSSHREDETEDFIRRMYVPNRTRFLDRAARSRFVAESAINQGISADRVRSTVDYAAATAPFDYLVFLSVRAGRVEIAGAGQEVVLLPGGHCAFPTGVELELRTHAVDVKLLRVPVDAVRVAAAQHGLDDRAVCFDGFTPESAVMARHWGAVMDLANSTLLKDDAITKHPLLVSGLAHTVAVTALHTFRNNVVRQIPLSAGAVQASALRRAIAFVDENAHRPITVADIADAAGVSARGLQFAFARHRDTTPMQYLRLVRLTHAHRDLQLAEPLRGETVDEIAHRWGFSNSSRFAAYYRDAFGVTPQETLRS